MASKETLWPALETGYLDEFGPVDPEVHHVARDLWPRAEHIALDLTGDAARGYRLLKRAVAAISALSAERREQIRDLPAYLFQAYKRLVLADLEKVNGHRAGDLLAAQILGPSQPGAEAVERHILVAQLVSRMDPWTREVFENLTLATRSRRSAGPWTAIRTWSGIDSGCRCSGWRLRSVVASTSRPLRPRRARASSNRSDVSV